MRVAVIGSPFISVPPPDTVTLNCLSSIDPDVGAYRRQRHRLRES
jgi:hypothetical protein